MATFLRKLLNECQFNYLHPYMSTNPENMVKIDLVDFEIFCGNANFCPIIPKVKISHLIISIVNGPNFIKFVYNVVRSLTFNILKSELRYSNLYQNATMPNNLHKTIWLKKFGCHGNILKRSENEVQIDNLRTNFYHLVTKL